MAKKQTVHTIHDFLFFMLLLGFVSFIIMSELRFKISQLALPFQYWKQLMMTSDKATSEYFYDLLNGKS
jgi:hypothetical protein